ncbi:MAG: Na+/H+ antiporter NhaC family protein [Succinivibrio sp.]|jgi:Na+/H+ antiporter NhaC|nr:Na+/H+ antiporter NhaC family protein [Succinivibrio sp.]
MDPFNAGWLSILPPVIAVVLALATKEVFSSLLIGILTGTAIYTVGMGGDGSYIVGTVENAFKVMGNKFDINIVLFCSLLGSLVYVISLAGGTKAYGTWATSHIKSRRNAMISTSVLGAFIFIDDYFNCLTVGTVMRPITDTFKISREKLAYIIDATAAPVCIIAPISSWAAAVGSNLKDTKAFDSEMAAFVSTIPWNFYALLCISMVLILSFIKLDFGPMYKAEQNTLKGEDAGKQDITEDESTKDLDIAAKGTVWDMIVPIVMLIIFSTCSLLYVGGYWGSDEAYHSIGAAFGNTDAGPALVLGVFAALVVAFAMFVGRRLMSIKTFMDGVLRGVQTMIPACMILTFAWTISGVCRDLLQTQVFISTIVQNDTGFLAAILPAIIFAIASFLSFSTGTAWGTFGILIPIVVVVAQAVDPSGSELTVITLSATLAGSVFGDHCSPISDTTILSSAGAGCVHIEHVYTQLPYALLVAACCFIGYVVAGLTYSLPLSLGTAFVLMIGALYILHRRNQKTDGAAPAQQA